MVISKSYVVDTGENYFLALAGGPFLSAAKALPPLDAANELRDGFALLLAALLAYCLIKDSKFSRSSGYWASLWTPDMIFF